ncbi:MAG TPA: hypothetical protein VGG75_32620 [Trebonia sp.]
MVPIVGILLMVTRPPLGFGRPAGALGFMPLIGAPPGFVPGALPGFAMTVVAVTVAALLAVVQASATATPPPTANTAIAAPPTANGRHPLVRHCVLRDRSGLWSGAARFLPSRGIG